MNDRIQPDGAGSSATPTRPARAGDAVVRRPTASGATVLAVLLVLAGVGGAVFAEPALLAAAEQTTRSESFRTVRLVAEAARRAAETMQAEAKPTASLALLRVKAAADARREALAPLLPAVSDRGAIRPPVRAALMNLPPPVCALA